MSDGLGAFRPLAPSRRSVASSSSTTDYEATPLSPNEQTAHDSDNGQSLGTAEHTAFLHRSRKRRAPAHVSQNACTTCKKARSKCDGVEPAACNRCLDRGVECQYEVHIKTAKEEMMRRIKDLELSNRAEREKSAYLESFIQALRSNDHGPEAIGRLRLGQTLQQVADFLGDPRYHDMAKLSPASEKRIRAAFYSPGNDGRGTSPSTDSVSRWSSVPVPDMLKEHLVCLYFTWFHPVHMLFSEKHFVSSLQAGGSTASLPYCTPSMVNFMCAIGCTVLTDAENSLGDGPERYQLQFRSQALADLSREDTTKPTWSISYALLFLLELCTGQARKASSHLRAAVESLPMINRDGYDEEAFDIASWGIHTLTTTWAGFTYVKPHNPASTRTPVFQSVQPDLLQEPWRFYRLPGDHQRLEDLNATRIPSHSIQTAKEAAVLDQMIHETMNVYCGSRGKVSGSSIVTLYRQFMQWRSSLPPPLQIRTKPPPAPHILFLHVHYSTALCQLLQPLLVSDLFPIATQNLLRDIILKTAKEGLDILDLFAQTYSHRYHTPMQLFCLVHLGDTLLQGDRLDAEAAIRFVFSALHEAQESFAIAGPLAIMFSERVEEHNLRLSPEILRSVSDARGRFGTEEKLDACERLTYAQPIKQLLSRLDPAIATQFEKEWQAQIEYHGAAGSETASGVPGIEVWVNGGGPSPSPGISDGSHASRSSEGLTTRSVPSGTPTTTATNTPIRRQFDVNSLINP